LAFRSFIVNLLKVSLLATFSSPALSQQPISGNAQSPVSESKRNKSELMGLPGFIWNSKRGYGAEGSINYIPIYDMPLYFGALANVARKEGRYSNHFAVQAAFGIFGIEIGQTEFFDDDTKLRCPSMSPFLSLGLIYVSRTTAYCKDISDNSELSHITIGLKAPLHLMGGGHSGGVKFRM
jgi:hypothetical protein